MNHMSLNRLLLYLTWDCNLRCRHCWVSASHTQREIMDIHILKQSIVEGVKNGLKMVKLSGGEPFLCPSLIHETIQLCREYNLDLNIETNGTLISKDILLEIGDLPIYINISIDSDDEQIHNDIRGSKDAYTQAFKGMELLHEYGISFGVTHTICNENLHRIDKLIEVLSNYNVKSLKLNPIMTIGRAKSDIMNSPYLLEIDYFDLLVRKYHCNTIKGVFVSTMVPPCFLTTPEIIIGKKVPFNCGYLNQLGILPNGQVGLCGEAKDFSEFIFGDLRRNSLSDIWNNSVNLNKMRSDVNMGMDGICNKCGYHQMCLGGCRIAANLYRKGYNTPHPFADQYSKLHNSLPYMKNKAKF